MVVSTNKAGQIRDLINQYLIEANSGQYDYVKALAEFSSKDESALTFKKGEIIAVVPKHDAYTEKVRNKELKTAVGSHDQQCHVCQEPLGR